MKSRKLCPECVKADLKSKLFDRGSGSTLLGNAGQSFYDEEGVWHRHDPNIITQVWECSNGHKWTERLPHPCPSCSWPEPPKPFDPPNCMCNYPHPCPNQAPRR